MPVNCKFISMDVLEEKKVVKDLTHRTKIAVGTYILLYLLRGKTRIMIGLGGKYVII